MQQLLSIIEVGLTLVFVGRSLTRLYLRRAVARFGADALAFAQTPESGVVPAWVSLVLVSGWVVAAAGALSLLLG